MKRKPVVIEAGDSTYGMPVPVTPEQVEPILGRSDLSTAMLQVMQMAEWLLFQAGVDASTPDTDRDAVTLPLGIEGLWVTVDAITVQANGRVFKLKAVLQEESNGEA